MDEQTQELCARLGRLPDEVARREFLKESPQLLQTSVVEDLAEIVRRQVRVDVPQALEFAEAAIAVAHELEQDSALALGLRAKANALWFMGDCKSAAELFHQAAGLFERVGNWNEVGRTLSTSIQSHLLLGQYDEALAIGQRAKKIFTDLGESWRLARLEINVANIYHRQNRFVQALASYKAAYEQLLPHKDAEGIGVALHNMAVCLIALDDFHGALDTYRRMREFCERADMPLLVAQADYNIAYLYYLRGDYTRALEMLRVSRETCLRNGDKYHLALCDLDESEIYLELRLIEEAQEMAQSSYEQFEKLGINYEAARALANSAVLAGLQGKTVHSVELFARAKECMLREKNQVWPSLLDLYQSLVLLEAGDYANARRLCTAALEFFRSAQMPSKHVFCLALLARVLLKAGEVDSAAACAKEALDQVATLDAPILFYEAQFVMGQVYEAQGNQEEAYQAYQYARQALDTLRSSLQTEELKISFMRDKSEVYRRLVNSCLRRDSTQASKEEAFSYMEEAKSRALRDLIAGRAPVSSVDDGAENGTGHRIREMRKELNWYYRRIDREQLSQEGAPPELIESLRLRARSRERELLHLLREHPPEGAQSRKWGTSGTASVAEIRASLGQDEELIEYFNVEGQVLAAVLTAESLDFVPLTHLSSLVPRLRMLQFQMAKFRLGRDYVSHFNEALCRATQRHLKAIYDEVFAPLQGRLRARHIIFVPYGPLHSLPFHALFDGKQFLIENYTISYAPSASIHSFCQRQTNTKTGRSLIFGVDDSRTPFVRQEVEAVAAIAPDPEVFFGSAATEKALREEGARSRMIHIASHGQFRQDSPMFSSIRLADSYLSLYDLYHMDLPANLLTLSGCATGLSVVAGGDELLGLSRGLLYAGARSLLLSLWDVDDRSTAEFMQSFYSNLREGTDKAEALRSTMLELRSRYPHPYYWAPFQLMGKSLN